MKSVVILHPFRDKLAFNTVYGVGEIREFDDDRVRCLVSLGLVEEVTESTKTPEKVEKPKVTAKGRKKSS